MSGAAVNSFDHFGWTPLHEAANHGDVPTIKALLKHPSTEVNTVGGHEVKKLGMTPLHDAAGEPPSQRLSFFGGKGKKMFGVCAWAGRTSPAVNRKLEPYSFFWATPHHLFLSHSAPATMLLPAGNGNTEVRSPLAGFYVYTSRFWGGVLVHFVWNDSITCYMSVLLLSLGVVFS